MNETTSSQSVPGPHTALNGVTGFPLGHTLSPKLHLAIYRLLGIDAVMEAFPTENIGEMLREVRARKIGLLAVTIPHKQEVMKYLDAIDGNAQEIGAVNTVINREGRLTGYNTDVTGVEAALKNTQLEGKNVLALGAGGAARPLCWFLKKHGAKIFCLNRTRTKAEELMKEFGGAALDNETLPQAKIDVIVNATPVGMSPDVGDTPLDKKFLRTGQTVFDFIYNPPETRLLKEAKEAGCRTISGMPMLIAQALEQVRLWCGKELDARQKETLEKEMSQP